VVGALVLMVGRYLAWIHHDHAEQAIGEHTCEAAAVGDEAPGRNRRGCSSR
jgi:hypothetical protein